MYSVITTYLPILHLANNVTNLKTVQEYATITVILQRRLWIFQNDNLTFKAVSERVN